MPRRGRDRGKTSQGGLQTKPTTACLTEIAEIRTITESKPLNRSPKLAQFSRVEWTTPCAKQGQSGMQPGPEKRCLPDAEAIM